MGYKLNRSAPERGKMKPADGERSFNNERRQTGRDRRDSGDKGESQWDLGRENFCRMANREMKPRGGEKKVICEEGRGGRLKRSDIGRRTKLTGLMKTDGQAVINHSIQRSTSFWGLISKNKLLLDREQFRMSKMMWNRCGSMRK